MANICEFEMIIKGKEENMNSFIKAMAQEDEYCMGRGAWIISQEDFENEKHIEAECKWSVWSALYNNAMSMRHQKETGEGNWYNGDGFIDEHKFITMVDATLLWDLEVEIVSYEPGCEFSEHYLIRNGELLLEQETEYAYICDEDDDNYEEVGGFAHLF